MRLVKEFARRRRSRWVTLFDTGAAHAAGLALRRAEYSPSAHTRARRERRMMTFLR